MCWNKLKEYPSKPDTVYYFGTCLVDLIYPQAVLAGIRLMQREGVEVIFPQKHTCCGQSALSPCSCRIAGWIIS